ncbi:hypothetical protein E4U35_005911, partial [Claviceps purpurea]
NRPALEFSTETQIWETNSSSSKHHALPYLGWLLFLPMPMEASANGIVREVLAFAKD